MKTLKKIPRFRNEKEEAEFWRHHDAADYIDFTKSQKLSMPGLKPSTKSISIRLPEPLLERIKIIANKKDVPYQSLIKVYLSEKVKDDM